MLISNLKIIFVQVLKIKLLTDQILHSVDFNFVWPEIVIVTIISLEKSVHCSATQNKIITFKTTSEFENDFVHWFKHVFQIVSMGLIFYRQRLSCVLYI
jgi:hypothetical protein